jgi:diguanylate cyclase (GGDEF)-like protein/PAS domain S-box-containing protein
MLYFPNRHPKFSFADAATPWDRRIVISIREPPNLWFERVHPTAKSLHHPNTIKASMQKLFIGFHNWIHPPRFSNNEDENRHAEILNSLILAVFLLMLVMLPILFLTSQVRSSTKIIDTLFLLAAVLLRVRLSAGRVNQVGFWFILGGFLLLTSVLISVGTYLSPTTSGYILLIILSGILFGTRGLILSVGASSLLVGCMLIAMRAGWMASVATTDNFTSWAVYSMIFGVIGTLTQFFLQSSYYSLQKANCEIEERKLTEEKLKQSEARFRNLFEHTHDAVFMMDLSDHYLMVNQQACDMLGYTSAELLTLSVSDISAEIDQTREIHERLLQGEYIAHYDRYFRKKDGTIFPVEINLELIKDAGGNPQYIQSIARDISQRKLAEEDLKAANEELSRHVAEVEHLQKELREQVIHDPLTGVYNRRYLDETLECEIARADRERNDLSLILLDIDHFKEFNDSFGHQAGDLILVDTMKHLTDSIRGSDIICRFGGEEFILVLPGINLDTACKRAEEIRKTIEANKIHYGDEELGITISMGVAGYPGGEISAAELIDAADRALYRSKETGRNKVSIVE